MSADVDTELARAAIEWQASEAKEARAREASVAELIAESPAAGPAPSPAPAAAPGAPQDESTQLTAADHKDLAKLVWTIIDVLAVRFGGQTLKLQPDEEERLIEPTQKVLAKYLPADLKVGPEWVLAGVAGAIYVPKLMASDAASSAPQDAAPAVTA